MADWGVHWLYQIMLWSGEKGQKKIFCTGGRPIAGPAVLNDKEQTTDAPDHQGATFEFEQFTAVWEHRKFHTLKAAALPSSLDWIIRG